MKLIFIIVSTFFSVLQTNAQQAWVTKKIQPQIELQFPVEPQDSDYGDNHNWLVFVDSTVFQFSKGKYEDTSRSSFRRCKISLDGIIDGCKGKLIRSDSAKISGFCALYFTVKATASPIENFTLKGFTLDMNGKSFILMATTEKADLRAVNRFINSFKIVR